MQLVHLRNDKTAANFLEEKDILIVQMDTIFDLIK